MRRVWRVGALAVGAGTLSTAIYYSRPEPQRRLIRVSLGGVNRFIRSSVIGAGISFDYWWSMRGVQETDPAYAETLSGVHSRSARSILKGCLCNGGLYIKLGQGLVVMDHLLPKEYIQTLKVLQDRCLHRNRKEMEQLFMEDFGKPANQVFQHLDEDPIAAASLAQVYKGRTQDGMEVAVKVQYLDLRDRFAGDMATVQLLLNVAAKLYPDFDFAWVLKELRGTLEKELDFVNEAKNSERCAADLKHLSFVHIPKVFWSLTTQRVLTTEFINGVKISDKDELIKRGFSLADVDTKLFKTFAEQIFHTGFVHADPHPGNVLVRKGKDGRAQLVILDHGLYEDVPVSVREPLRLLWKSIVLNDHPAMKKYSVQLGVQDEYRLLCMAMVQRYVPPQDPSEDDFIKLFFPEKKGERSAFSRMSPEERALLTEKIYQVHDNMLKIFRSLPAKYILVSRNINTIRSIARGHGDPVDRYRTMARCATQGAFTTSPNASFSTKIKSKADRLNFEFKLWWGGVKMWFFKLILNLYLWRGKEEGQVAIMGR